jgi:hypothetical protein
MSSDSIPVTAGTSGWLQNQWANPNDIFTILSILGGDVVRKAIGQLSAGPVPYFCPVSFSFGWVRITTTVVPARNNETIGSFCSFCNALGLR